MKIKHFLLTYFLVYACISLSAQDPWIISSPLNASELKQLQIDEERVSFYDNTVVSAVINPDGSVDENTLTEIIAPSTKLKEQNYSLSLVMNPFAPATELSTKNFVATVFLKLAHFSQATGLDSIEHIKLEIDYNSLIGKYKAKDYFQYENRTYYRINVDSIFIFDRNTNNFVANFTPFDDLFELRQSLHTIKMLQPIPADVPSAVNLSESANAAYLVATWGSVSWAVSYDLEWTFVDDYPMNAAGAGLDPASLQYDFSHNATRVNIAGPPYSFPKIFDHGYVIIRVRAVGQWGNAMHRIEGDWSLNETGPVTPANSNVWSSGSGVSNVHLKGSMNWKYEANYVEDGKRKDMMAYQDGTDRERQRLTNLSSDHQLLAGTTVYDHQGREAVSFIPSPVFPGPPAPEPPPIVYVNNFQVNQLSEEYSRNDLGMDMLNCASEAPMADPAGNSSGAARYFSPMNPYLNNENAYLPDALGYPFSYMEYTPDLTGRIRRMGTPGPVHQPGNGHDVQYFYTVPAQNELDRMFGNDVGYAQHYKKEVRIDENRLTEVVYKNNRNEVIASALAGEKPENLLALDNQLSKTIQIDVLDYGNDFSIADREVCSYSSFYISGNPEIPVNLTIDYTMSNSSFTPEDCSEFCYSCVYDLNIRIIHDQCLDVVLDTVIVIGNLANLINCNPINVNPVPSIIKSINPGPYIISKCLVINEEAIESAVEHYNLNCNDPMITEIPEGDCSSAPCVVCQDSIINLGSLNMTFRKKMNTVVVSHEFRAKEISGCDQYCPDTLNQSIINSLYISLLGDMSPGGQYGFYRDTLTRSTEHPLGIVNPSAYPLSIYNEDNLLPLIEASWRFPFGNYRDIHGNESLIRVPIREDGRIDSSFFVDRLDIVEIDGIVYSYPQNLTHVKDFIENWQESWAQALLPYHPEFFYYRWSKTYNQSYVEDYEIQQIQTYSDAVSSVLAAGLNLLDADYTNDFDINPFWLDYPTAHANKYQHFALKFSESDAGTKYNVLETVIMNAHCGMSGWSELQTTNCVTANSPMYSTLDPDELDAEWNAYKSFALQLKKATMDWYRQKWIETEKYFNNRHIGEESETHYNVKEKRFINNQDMEYDLRDIEGEVFTADIAVYESYFNSLFDQACDECEAFNGLVNLLHSLLYKTKFDQVVNYPTAPPLVFPDELLSAYGIYGSNTITYDPVVIGPHHVEAEILADAVVVDYVIFETDAVDFYNIDFISCFERDPLDDHKLIGLGWSEGLDSTHISIYSQSFDFNQNCMPSAEIICRDTLYLQDLLVLFEAAYVDELFWDSPGFLLYPNLPIPDYLGEDLINRLEEPDIYITQMIWEQIGINLDSTEVFINLTISSLTLGDDFSFFFDISGMTPGFNVNDIAEVVAGVPVNVPISDTLQYDFTIKALSFDGLPFEIFINTAGFSPEPAFIPDTLFPVFACRTLIPEAADSSRCCIRPVRFGVQPDCEQILADMAELNENLGEDIIRIQNEEAFEQGYIAHCLEAVESLILQYEEKSYQHTLYYRDLVGNLIQSVPPKGVVLLSDAEVINVQNNRAVDDGTVKLPSDSLFSTYSYTSLNGIFHSKTPDNGNSWSFFDQYGRLILSQNENQNYESKHHYFLYDEQGRPKERGTIASPAGISLINDYDNYVASLIGTRAEIFQTHYDELLPGTENYFISNDRNLRNRVVALSYSDSVGVIYSNGIHYGYDIMGNVNEFVQDFPFMEENMPDSLCTSFLNFDEEIIMEGDYSAYKNIKTSSQVQISPETPVLFQAGSSIEFGPGFEASGEFTAQIGPCIGNFGEIFVDTLRFFKRISYDYDLFSGNIRRTTYQPGQADQFIHWYSYDADNRLTEIKTSTLRYEPFDYVDSDAKLFYYAHGPLARVEMGAESVQGIDFAYTIRGHLKGINSSTLFPERDIGKDGTPARSQFGKDAYGMELGYFTADYSPIAALATIDRFDTDISGSPLETMGMAQYNGNIWYTGQGINKFSESPLQLSAYAYDQLSRIKKAQRLVSPDFINNSWTDPVFSTHFESNYSYDPNGNLMSLQRKDAAGALIDDLTYQYYPDKNQLQRIEDGISSPYPNDLENQSGNNYSYDLNGRLSADVAAQVTNYEWMQNEQIKSIQTPSGDTNFGYNAMGLRVSKQTPERKSFYVRDINGQLVAEYDITGNNQEWLYSPIYGGETRFGIFNPGYPLEKIHGDTTNQHRRNRQYELKNQVGNVMVSVSDRKIPGNLGLEEFDADVVSASDYYPFGMLLPGREDSSDYSFGFQGMKRDDDHKGTGNSYTTEFRQYDPRIGRWASIDPVIKANESPYVGFSNAPIILVDPLGSDTSLYHDQYVELFSNTSRELYQNDEEFQGLVSIYQAASAENQRLNLIASSLNSGLLGGASAPNISNQITPEMEFAMAAIRIYVNLTIQRQFGNVTIEQAPMANSGTISAVRGRPREATREEMDAYRAAHPTLAQQVRSDLAFLTGNPIGSGVFAGTRLSGHSVEESMRFARNVNSVWSIYTGARGFRPGAARPISTRTRYGVH